MRLFHCTWKAVLGRRLASPICAFHLGISLVGEHCRPDHNRNRELHQALEILERTCECGNDKMLLPDGKLGSTCQEYQDLDARQRRRRA